MMTGREYIESLRALKMQVCFLGQRIRNIVDEPMF
jgi:aromatic ring hydroxylase